MPEQVLNWAGGARLFNTIEAAFGSTPKASGGRKFSTSPYPGGAQDCESSQQIQVLLAEDNPGDVFLVREALESHGLDAQLTVREDGEEMLRLIDRIEAGDVPCPDIVLLDLNLPKRSGEVLLQKLREMPVCAGIPVIIVTSSDSPRDRETAARLGANSYFRKPADFDEFLRLGAIVKEIVGRV